MPASHQTIASCSGRALCRPRTKPSPVVVAAPCAGLAPVIQQTRRDVRSSVRKRRAIDGLTICHVYQRASTTAYGWVVRWYEDKSPTQSNRTQPVGTYVRASASEEQSMDRQYVMFINVRQRPHTVGVFVGCGRSNERPYCQGWIIACVTYCSLLARPAQGAATTTGDGLVRTLERASLRLG